MKIGRVLGALVATGVAAAVVAWAMGAFHGGKVRPGTLPAPEGLAAPARTVVATRGPVSVVEEAVGTVRSRNTVDVAAQVIARVLEVVPRSGTAVKTGDLLARLDDREFQARLDQAKKALAAADAARLRADQAKAQAAARLTQTTARWERQRTLRESAVTTSEQAEAAETDYLLARAGAADADAAIAAADALREQAQQVVREAEVALGYTRMTAPFDGVVVERKAEPGDLASPGRVLLVVLDPAVPQLEAAVREGLIARVEKGTTLDVVLPTAGVTVAGRVTEIVPSADPRTRTFTVRADFDPVKGVHSGMFGRLRIPVGTRDAVRVPADAIVRVGQLETVVVEHDGRWERRLVTTGARGDDGLVEVLSGLAGGETLGRPEGRP